MYRKPIDVPMKTLQLILNLYNEGKITLNEMIDMINEFGEYAGYKNAYGKQTLKAYVKGEFIFIQNILMSHINDEDVICDNSLPTSNS